VKIIFKKGIEHEDMIAKLNVLTTYVLQIANASDFSLLKVRNS
jgi:hypothetical protein